ncbi:MAG: 3-hydroxyacyl-[acyl-carrier-protein] dehydratase FabZ, partial [Pseudomonadota bacterium]
MDNAPTAPEAKPGTVIDINRIMRMIPHRYPFLLIDRIVEL